MPCASALTPSPCASEDDYYEDDEDDDPDALKDPLYQIDLQVTPLTLQPLSGGGAREGGAAAPMFTPGSEP